MAFDSPTHLLSNELSARAIRQLQYGRKSREVKQNITRSVRFGLERPDPRIKPQYPAVEIYAKGKVTSPLSSSVLSHPKRLRYWLQAPLLLANSSLCTIPPRQYWANQSSPFLRRRVPPPSLPPVLAPATQHARGLTFCV